LEILFVSGQVYPGNLNSKIHRPKPAYTTVGTIVKILENKGFVSHKSYGNAYQYYPLISKEEYSEKHLNPLFSKYFKGSVKDMVSFFADNNKMDIADIEDTIEILTELKKKKT